MEASSGSHASKLMPAPIAVREQELVNQAKERGYVTFEEVQDLYPPDDEYFDAIDALLARLIEEGVTPIPAASVQSVIVTTAVAPKREVAAAVGPEVRPLSLVGLYMEEIRRFPLLTHDQEMWLGIAMECPKLMVDHSPSMKTSGTFVHYLLGLAVRKGKQFANALAHHGRSTVQIHKMLDNLVQEVQSRQMDPLCKSSALSELIKQCPKRIWDNLFDLCDCLYALPVPALQSFRERVLGSGSLLSQTEIDCSLLEGHNQSGSLVEEIYHRFEQAKNILVLHNLRLAASVAWRYRDRGLPLLDLCQEGNLGLIKAAEAFDYRQGNRFSTYAMWWIRQSIVRAIADQSRTIRLPVHMHEALSKIHRAEDALKAELGRSPSARELASRCGMSLKRLKRVLKREPRICSLDSLLCCPEFPLGWDESEGGFVQIRPCPTRQLAQLSWLSGDDSDYDSLEYPPCVSYQGTPGEKMAVEENVDYSMLMLSTWPLHERTLDGVMLRQLKKDLNKVLDELSVRQRMVIERRFGLKDGQACTLEEIGQELGVTREWVRQIEVKALNRLRHPVRKKRLSQYR